MTGLGESLSLDDGDLVIEDSDLVLVDNTDNVAQGLYVLLTTQLGSDLLNPTYGFDAASLFQTDLSEDELIELAELKLRSALLQDDRVDDIYDITIEIDEYREMHIECTVRLIDDTEVYLSTNLSE